MSKTKYTKERLEPLVKESTSIAQVLRKLGLKEAGGSHSHISRKIKEYKLNTSHFLGQGSNRGKAHKGGPKKKHWKEILIKKETGRREYAFRLRRALIESGRAYECESCGAKDEWNGKPLMLQVDHKNCNWLDNRKNNLAFMCPNCHSQTDGWCGSKGYSEVTTAHKRPKNKSEQNEKQEKNDLNWRIMPKVDRRKVDRPSYKVLKKEIRENGHLSTGRKYGVSDNAVRKWIKCYEKWSELGIESK